MGRWRLGVCVVSYAAKLADLYAVTLEEQLTSSTKKEQKKLLEGVLVGLKYFLNHHANLFPKGVWCWDGFFASITSADECGVVV